MSSAALAAAADAILARPAGVPHDKLMLAHAISYAVNGWPVFPLYGKTPAIGNPHPRGSVERYACKGECSLDGHGLYDATTDTSKVAEWWTGRYRNYNIGGRVPAALFVLDSDPRTAGHLDAAAKLHSEHGPLAPTLMTISGCYDGGTHRFYRHPGGKLSTDRLGPGFDIKDHGGYVVLPPSVHPETGWHYIEVDRTIAEPDSWLIDLMRPAPKPRSRHGYRPLSPLKQWNPLHRMFASSIADDYTSRTTWADVLTPHGWMCIAGTGDEDGSIWLHPTHTSSCSATVRNGCLFVYSTNTPFTPTTAGNRHGYTRFRAYAVLNHGGDLQAAARHLRSQMKAS